MNSIRKGNAAIDGQLTRQWIVGPYMPRNDLRKADKVEIKWASHAKGKARRNWVTRESRTTISILVSGLFIMEFRDESVRLSKQGDYVMRGMGVDHRWKALEDTVIITVRWPSSI